MLDPDFDYYLMVLFGLSEEDDIAMADQLSRTLNDFQNNVLFSSIVNTIPIFRGEQSKYKVWADAVDRAYILMNKSDYYAIRAAAQTSESYVSRYIQQYWTEKKEAAKWAELKEELQTQFDFSLDSISAMVQLRTVKQKADQTYQMFAEELQLLAAQAYSAEELETPVVIRELVAIFTGGLIHGKVRAHLYRHPPVTMKAAIKAAHDEGRLIDRVDRLNTPSQAQQSLQPHTSTRNVSRREETMECDVVRFQYTESGQPICNRCGLSGHIVRNCRVRVPGNNDTGNRLASERNNTSYTQFRQPNTSRNTTQQPQPQQQPSQSRPFQRPSQPSQQQRPQSQQNFNRPQGGRFIPRNNMPAAGNGRFQGRQGSSNLNRAGGANFSRGTGHGAYTRNIGFNGSNYQGLVIERADGTKETLPRGTKLILVAEGHDGVVANPLNWMALLLWEPGRRRTSVRIRAHLIMLLRRHAFCVFLRRN